MASAEAPPPTPERWAIATGAMPLHRVVEAVRLAEAAGCEAALVGEGLSEADGVVASAAALAATRRIRVGPAMLSGLDRHPVALARAAVTLDRLAPGRTLLGIGRGERSDATGRLGLDWAGSTAALEDALRICRSLLGGRGADHAGARWSAHLDPLPSRSAANRPVPVLLAAVGERTLRLAGAAADGVALNYGAAPEYVEWALGRVAEGRRAAGRPGSAVDVFGYVLVARTDVPDGEAQVAAVHQTLERLLAVPGQGAALLAPLGLRPGKDLDPGLVARLAAIGDAAAVGRRLDELRAAGLRCPVLLPAGLRALRAGQPPTPSL